MRLELSSSFCRFLRSTFAVVAIALSSGVLAYYLRYEPLALVWIIGFVLEVWAAKAIGLIGKARFRVQKKITAVIGLVSFVFGVAIILGFHIVFEAAGYTGLASENYISDYSAVDLVALALMWPGLFVAFLAPVQVGLRNQEDKDHASNPKELDTAYSNRALTRTSPKQIALFAVIMFAAWMPYLLTYWPGFIFGDTLSSLSQIYGEVAWNNHHPFFYTLFIKCCLGLGTLLGVGNTGGVAIYSLLQMAFMAVCLAYLSQWMPITFFSVRRSTLHRSGVPRAIGAHLCA